MQPAPFHQLPPRRASAPLPPAECYWLRADDGVRLRIALWRSTRGTPGGTILLFPGRTEYAERYDPVARELADAGLNVLTIDWRGQGLADRLPGDEPRLSRVAAFADYQRDVVEMIVAAQDLSLPQPWHLLAHSMGGAIGLAALLNGLPVQTATFSAPMWGLNTGALSLGLAGRAAALANRLGAARSAVPLSGGKGCYFLDNAFTRNVLTGCPDEWARFVAESGNWPDVTLGGVSWQWLGQAIAECQRLADLPSPELPDLPVLVGLGTNEKVISPLAIKERLTDWPSAQLLMLDGARHEPMMERAAIRDAFLNAVLDHIATG